MKGFLSEEMRKYFPIYEEAVSYIYMTLQLLHSEFPYMGGQFDFLYYHCAGSGLSAMLLAVDDGRGQCEC